MTISLTQPMIGSTSWGSPVNTNWQSVQDAINNSVLIPNYCTNGDAEVDTTGWATYADAAGTEPVDGTGGSPHITWTRTTSSPIDGVGSFLLTKDAANRQGEGVSFTITVPAAYIAFNLPMFIELTLSKVSGTFNLGDVVLSVYDITNGFLLYVWGGTGNLTSSGALNNVPTPQRLGFASNLSATGTYRVCIHISSTSASAYSIAFDDIRVYPALDQPAGCMLQETGVTDTTNRSTTSTTYVDSGVPAAALSYRTRGAVRIRVHGISSNSTVGATGRVRFKIYRSVNGAAYSDATPGGLNNLLEAVSDVTSLTIPFSFELRDGAQNGSISYKLYWSVAAGTGYLGRRASDTTVNCPTFMMAEEIL